MKQEGTSTSRIPERISPAYTVPGWPPSAYPSGIVSYTSAMIEGCRALGGEPLVLAWNIAAGHEGNAVVSITKEDAVEEDAVALPKRIMARCFPQRVGLSWYRRRVLPILRHLADSGRVDLLETEETYGMAYALLKYSPVPIVIRLHGPWFLVGDALGVPKDKTFRRRVRAEGRLIAAADGVSAPSEATLSAVREYYGLRLPRSVVVPNPSAEYPAELSWRAGECEPGEILFVGRFDRCKGGDLVIRAFRSIAERIPGTRLVFAGPDMGLAENGGVLTTMESYAREHLGRFAEPPHFSWLGAVPHSELAALRKRAAVIIVASRFENFPMVLLEAHSQGCPVVASDAGGISEIVRDGKNGLLFRSGDADDLATKMEILLRHPDLAARLGQEAQRTWRQKYRPRVVAEEMMEFYRGVLQTSMGSTADRRPRRPRLWEG